MNNVNKKIIVAMSGGVDSSVSAAILKEQGYDVVGVFMKCWSASEMPQRYESADELTRTHCTAEEDEYWARRAAQKIGIPFYSVNLVDEYKKRIVDYFVREYKAGRTPNPDVMCNNEIKFGVFYDKVINDFGADYLATGHYARLEVSRTTPRSTGGSFAPDAKARMSSSSAAPSRAKPAFGPRATAHGARETSTVKLLRAKDKNKDQTYFLHRVPGERLARAIFPIGEYTKPEVRKLAKKFDLPNAEKKDSQGLCFVGSVDMQQFLEEYIPQKPGIVVTVGGEAIGEHKGVAYYTIGQRKGVGTGGGGVPYYVVDKDTKTNTLVVGKRYEDKLFKNSLALEDVVWVNNAPKMPAKVTSSIRYRQEPQEATLKPTPIGLSDNPIDSQFILEFKESQRAVTPGQMAVIYNDEEVLGGGIIR